MKMLLSALLGLFFALPAPALADAPSGVDASVLAGAPLEADVPGLPAATEAEAPAGKKKPPFGFGGWFHVGGGAGAMIGARKVHPTGRFDLGFGGYLFLVYGGLAMNLTTSSHLKFVATGVGYAGLAFPIPVVRPLLGFKFGGGVHVDPTWGPSPAITLGPQIGLHIGQTLGSRFGIRVMVDPAATVSVEHRQAGFEIIGTVALML